MSDFGWRKMAGGSGGGRFRTATPLSVRPQLRRGVAIPSTCPEWLVHYSADDIAMSAGGDYIFTGYSGGWYVITWPGLAYSADYAWTDLGLSHPVSSNALDTAWGAYVIGVDNGDSLYQWIYDFGLDQPCLVRFAPDTSGGVILYTWPVVSYGQIATTWHPSDIDGIYCFVQNYDDGTDPGHATTDEQVLIRIHRSSGARTDILTPAGSSYSSSNFTCYLGFVQYATGFCFCTRQTAVSYATHIVAYDIGTDTDATLDTGDEIQAWAGRQDGTVWWKDSGNVTHQAQVTVSGGAVSIDEVAVTCPDAFQADFGEFGVGDVSLHNWFANADRSLVFNTDGDEIIDFS